jgi:hypothetical protein
MQQLHILGITLALLLTISLIYGIFFSEYSKKLNPFADKKLLTRGLDKPPMWLYYDTSDVNSRWWADFGARSSRALNLPFLNLCYESIVNKNNEDYRIEVISGLAGVADLLGGWDALPSGLRNPIAPVNEAETNWIRSAILAKYGGLWLTPYSIAVAPFGKLPDNEIRFFGTDLDESYAGPGGNAVPGFRCIWCPKPEHPLFVEWEQICKNRLEARAGGQQIRGDAKWDWVALSNKYPNIVIDASAEGARKKGGKRIELEDLLATGHGGILPFDLSLSTKYVPLLWPELRDREMFGWFLRMDERQIMQSDTSVKYLLARSL